MNACVQVVSESAFILGYMNGLSAVKLLYNNIGLFSTSNYTEHRV